MSDKPSHIVGTSRPWRTLCGLGPNDPRRFPYVGQAAVDKHVAGYGLALCPRCAVILDGLRRVTKTT